MVDTVFFQGWSLIHVVDEVASFSSPLPEADAYKALQMIGSMHGILLYKSLISLGKQQAYFWMCINFVLLVIEMKRFKSPLAPTAFSPSRAEIGGLELILDFRRPERAGVFSNYFRLSGGRLKLIPN